MTKARLLERICLAIRWWRNQPWFAPSAIAITLLFLVAACCCSPFAIYSTFFGSPSAGDTRSVSLGHGQKIRLRWCPPGQFVMGSVAATTTHRNEQPPTTVVLTKGFWIGETEITQGQYTAIMEKNLSTYQGDMLPVQNVSQDDARAFCTKLSERTGLTVTLPTEFQWEYACRAGSSARYTFGEDAKDLKDYAFYASSTSGWNTTKHDGPSEVAKLRKNAWGLADVHGNVCEWTRSVYTDRLPGGKVVDPPDGRSGAFVVWRGGSFRSNYDWCRSAFRGFDISSTSSDAIGFRIVVLEK